MTAGTAVVTGGAHGLGAHIVRRLHAEGYRVAVADLDGPGAAALARELDPDGGARVRGYAVDVADPAALRELRDAVLADLGDLRVLVNNAARTRATPLLAIEPTELDEVLAVNVGGPFVACQLFGAHFAERGYGRIVNLASLAGQNGGTATGGHYAAAKGAVVALTKVFARELAGRGVTVNAVAPGPLDTPVVREIVGADRLAEYTRAIPVGALGAPEFVARMVALLAGPDAGGVTGACWDANGGLYLR